MELRQLEYFIMVSRLSSITRAAERLHTSQPNITTAIQKLENELGVQLFDRTQKRLTLTPEGQVFYLRIETALNSINEAITEIQDYKQMQKGAISIGIPPMIGSYLFPAILFRFQKAYPGVELTIVEDGSLSIREKLENGDLDLGIVILTDASAALGLLPMATRQILACLPRNHPLASQTSIAIPDLRDEPLILLKEHSYHRHFIMKECERHNFKPRIILSSNQIESIKGFVANGVGISFLFDVIANKETDIVSRPLADPVFVEIGLAWKKEKYLSNAARAFIDFIDKYSKDNPLIS